MKTLTPEQLEVGKIYKEQLSGFNVLIVERVHVSTDMNAVQKMFKYFYNGEFLTSGIDTGQFIEYTEEDIEAMRKKIDEVYQKYK